MTDLASVFRAKCRDLAVGESGSALALTLAFLLPVYLLAIGIYGVSETVRRKIELQNAADAAAYSAATVQADYLSRIAVLNKAVGWAYADLTRRELDWAMASFTDQTQVLFDKDFSKARTQNAKTCHPHAVGVNWNAGWTFSWEKGIIRRAALRVGVFPSIPRVLEEFNDLGALKRSLVYQKMTMARALVKGKGVAANTPKIIGRSTNLGRCVLQLKKIIGLTGAGEMKKAIEKAANDILDLNTREIDDEVLRYVRVGDPKRYITPLLNNSADEQTLLQHGLQLNAEGDYKPEKFFKGGIGHWLRRSSTVPIGSFRVYQQQKKQLHAEWSWYWTKWRHIIKVCTPPIFSWRYDYGDRVYDADKNPYHGFKSGMPVPLVAVAPAIAYTLNNPANPLGSLFADKGTIVVGLARKNTNPLKLFGGGMAGAFDASVCGGRRPDYIWALSAARAAYNAGSVDRRDYAKVRSHLESPEYALGYTDKRGKDRWNLCETDWDAMFVPVAAANDLTMGPTFVPNPLAKNILQEVMLDKNGWKRAEGSGKDRKWKGANVDWSKLEPPGGLARGKGQKGNHLDWKGLSRYLGH